MNDSTRVTGRKIDAFLNKLAELIDNLPTRESKYQVNKELETIIIFLQEFQERMKSLPASEDVDGIISTIETLKDYVRVAESDPVLSRVLGFSTGKSDRRSGKKPLTEAERIAANRMAEELKKMSPDEVQSKLSDKKEYTNALLKQIGSELGLKIPSKSTRVSIVEKIAKKVANLRGYDYLRHRTDEQS